jgi:hypothetical protein
VKKVKKFITLVGFLSLFILLTSPTSAQQLEYEANPNKSFMSVDEFFKQLDKEVYEEFKNVSFSVRQKIAYEDTPDALMTFEKKTGRYFGQPKQKIDPSVHPKRQVYFLASFVQNRNEEHWKHIIIDAETKDKLESGKSYHRFK